MKLLFQSPILLGLLALALLPFVVHLLSRARPQERIFSHIRFLKMVMRQTARIKKPRDRWLLILRSFALLCLAAAFSLPFLVGKNAALPGEEHTMILLMDRSASMAAREGAGSRLESASSLAESYLREVKPTQANLIWIDSQPAALFPAPGPNLDHIANELKRVQPLPEADNLPAAMELALQQLSFAKGHREVVIFSDFPAASWTNFQAALPPDVKATLHRVATSAPANIAVTQLLPTPKKPVIGQEIIVLVRTKNFSAEAVRSQLTVDAAGARQSQAIEIPSWGETETAFTIRPARAGILAISASLATDLFPADNARHAVLEVKESLLLRSDAPQDQREMQLMSKAARALGWLEIDPTTSNRQADFVFFSSWNDESLALITAEMAKGSTVIVRPSALCSLQALAKLCGLSQEEAIGAATLDLSQNGWKVIPNENYVSNQLFKSGDFGNPYAGTFRERLKLPTSWSESQNARPIARYTDGVPAAVAFQQGKSTLILWNLSLDPAKSDWCSQNSFLPAWGEFLLRHLPQSNVQEQPNISGTQLRWSSQDPSLSGSVTLLDPTQQPKDIIETTTQEGTLWTSKERSQPGIYRWLSSQQEIHLTAVEFPESESDLRSITQDPAFASIQQSSNSLARQAALSRGITLWPWLALAALLFLAMESLLHIRSTKLTTA